VGGEPRPDRLGGLDHDDGVPVRARGGPRLRMEEGSAGMGVSDSHELANPAASTVRGAANNPAIHSEIRRPDEGFYNQLSAEVGDKGFLVTTTEDLFQWARTG